MNGANICVDPGPERARVERGRQHLLDDTVTVTAPNSTSDKTNNTGGRSTSGDSSTWTITASNTGNGAAVFQAGEVIVGDTLPAGATYGAAERGLAVGVTGTGRSPARSRANVLTCTAHDGTSS